GEDGLALFSGISGPVEAAVRHPDFVPQTMTGITSVLGGLTFRDFSLDAGARVRARVRLKGQPREKDFCRFQALQEPPPEPVEARTDAQGICQPGQHFAPGNYLISALLRGTTVPLMYAVTLVEGQDLLEDFAFADVRVHGKVTKGGRPAPDLTVRFQQGAPEEDTTGWDRVEGAAKTGADGTYTLILPKPGSYTVGLLPQPKSPSPGLERTVVLKADEDKALDFTLQKIVIEGRILDARQYPVEGAWVRLDWNDGTDFTVKTGKQGEFTFYLETLGQGMLTAGKEGYMDAPAQEYDLDEEDDDIVPMVLILNPPGAGDGG
ncbi:MAG TPA: carboxypeptidase-like regulatory domain-containing protein, partial [Thermoanaerobaculia bacterium]